MSQPLDIAVYFDYICPWCYVATVRLLMLKEEFGEKIAINWKSFPLDPFGARPKYPLALLNQGRIRAGMEQDGLSIKPWPEDRALPASSMPAHEAARCARMQGREAFDRYHIALMKAYFSHCRDISDRSVLVSLAEEVHLDVSKFIADLESDLPKSVVLAEHEEAVNDGNIIGVPTVIIGQRAVLEAAVPLELYRRAVQRLG
jgi:predicted DsbA family dithiol-disulfide isomerase